MFQDEKVNKFRAKSKKNTFSKIALNRNLTLPDYIRGKSVVVALKIGDLQNNRFCKQFKHWKYRISVPMSYKNDDWGKRWIFNSQHFPFLSFYPILALYSNFLYFLDDKANIFPSWSNIHHLPRSFFITQKPQSLDL